MSDLRIADFRQRAERGLDVPDLADLERRGRGLQRRRAAAVVGALALAVVAGVGVAASVRNRDDASPHIANHPSPTVTSEPGEEGLRRVPSMGEEVFLPGRSEIRFEDLTLSFDVPGASWESFGPGMGLRMTPETRDDYAGAIFFLPDPGARQAPCGDAARVVDLGSNPARLLDNVKPLLHLARTRVLQPATVVRAFGRTAVHVQLESRDLCPEVPGSTTQLRGIVNGETVAPGFTGTSRLDLWHVISPSRTPRSVLIASWDLDSTARQRQDQQSLVESIRLIR